MGGVVETCDGYVVLQKRADWVAESQGCYDTPGGHAEPDELKKSKSEKSTIDNVFNADDCDIVIELFHSFIREVRDEANIPESSLSWPLLLGVNRNKQYGCKPGLVFYTQCSLSKEEVGALYSQGGVEADESTEIKFIQTRDLVDANMDDFLLLTTNMAPLGQLALALFVYHYKKLHIAGKSLLKSRNC